MKSLLWVNGLHATDEVQVEWRKEGRGPCYMVCLGRSRNDVDSLCTCRFSGIVRKDACHQRLYRIVALVPISLCICTGNKHNAMSPPCILLEILLVASWLRLRRRSNIQCLHKSHWSSAIVELKGSVPVCHVLQERRRWQVYEEIRYAA